MFEFLGFPFSLFDVGVALICFHDDVGVFGLLGSLVCVVAFCWLFFRVWFGLFDLPVFLDLLTFMLRLF